MPRRRTLTMLRVRAEQAAARDGLAAGGRALGGIGREADQPSARRRGQPRVRRGAVRRHEARQVGMEAVTRGHVRRAFVLAISTSSLGLPGE